MSDPTKEAVKAAAKEVAAELKGEVDGDTDLCPDCKKKPEATCKKKYRGVCHKCHQARMTCHDDHKDIDLTPVDKHFRKYYPGHNLNGVWYKGKSVVPAASANDLRAALNRWEEDERNMALGRDVEHNLGTLRGGGR